MSLGIRSLIKKGKKKSEKNLKKSMTPQDGGLGQSAAKAKSGGTPTKSIDDQSYKQWVHDHDNEDEQYIDEEGEEAIVLYNYTPNPSNEENDEIALEKDEIIIVYEQHVSGWWTGQSTKHGYGLFPGAFVRLLSQKPAATAATSSSSTTPAATPAATPDAATEATDSKPQLPAKPDLPAKPEPAAKLEPPAKPELPAAHKPADSSSPSSSPSSSSSDLKQVDDEPAPVKKSPSHIVKMHPTTTSASTTTTTPAPASHDASDSSCTDSLFLKTVLDQLYAKVAALQARVQQLDSRPSGGGGGADDDELERLRSENAQLRQNIEEMKIEKEVHGWKQDKELAELRKEVARLTEHSGGATTSTEIERLKSELAAEKTASAGLMEELAAAKKQSLAQVGALQQELARETATLERERQTTSQQIEVLLHTQKQMRDEIDALRASPSSASSSSSSSSPAAGSAVPPPDFMEQVRVFMQQQTAQMQSELQRLKTEVSAKEGRPGLEEEVAQLRRQLESEQQERAKLRQDLINQMTASQINRIKAEVLQRAEVKEGKLWDPVNNVFLAADGKWLRATGIDLTE